MLAIKDENGFVSASRSGMARIANITMEDFEIGIKCLESPDPDSRTTEYDGRRIEKIEGGWIILNHEKYRLHDDIQRDKTRERVRRYRERCNVVTKCSVTNTLPSVSVSDVLSVNPLSVNSLSVNELSVISRDSPIGERIIDKAPIGERNIDRPSIGGKFEPPTENANRTQIKRKVNAEPEIEIPAHIADMWPDYLEVRKAKKAPPTERAIKGILSKIVEYGGGNQSDERAILQQSIECGWTGVFPLRKNFNQPEKPKKYVGGI